MKRRIFIKSAIAFICVLFFFKKRSFADLRFSYVNKHAKSEGLCSTINDLRRYEPSFIDEIVQVKNFSHSISFIEVGIFFYDAYDKITPDNGGTCIVTISGNRWKRNVTDSINVNWFGAVGSENKTSIRQCIESGTFTSLFEVKRIFYGQHIELDDLWDNVAIQASFLACPKGVSVVFNYNKSYILNKGIKSYSCFSINGNGSTLIVDQSAPSNMLVLDIGEKLYDQPILDVTLEAGSDNVSRNLIGGDLKAGDLVSFYTDTIRSGKQFENIRPYFHGMRAKVIKVLEHKILLDRKIYNVLSLTRVSAHRGSELTSLKNIYIDATRFQEHLQPLSGVRLTGTNLVVHNVTMIGNKFCGAGLLLIGCKGHVFNSEISGFTNIQGLPLPGRVGYGIYVDCNDVLIENMTFKNNKHHVTCASRDFVMEGFVLKDSVGITDDYGRTNNVNAAFDIHSNVLGIPLFTNLDISTVGPAFNIRNGSARISNCRIVSNRLDQRKPGLINFFDYEEFSNFYFIDNDLVCSHNISLFHFGDLYSFTEIIVSNNKGSIGSIIDQVIGIKKIGVLKILNNVFNNLNSLLTLNLNIIEPNSSVNEVSEVTLKDNRFYCRSANKPLLLITAKKRIKVDKFQIINTLISSDYVNVLFENINFANEFIIENSKFTNSIKNNENSVLSFHKCNTPNFRIAGFLFSKGSINFLFDGKDELTNNVYNFDVENSTLGNFLMGAVDFVSSKSTIEKLHFTNNIFNGENGPFISVSDSISIPEMLDNKAVVIADNVFSSDVDSSFNISDINLRKDMLLKRNIFSHKNMSL